VCSSRCFLCVAEREPIIMVMPQTPIRWAFLLLHGNKLLISYSDTGGVYKACVCVVCVCVYVRPSMHACLRVCVVVWIIRITFLNMLICRKLYRKKSRVVCVCVITERKQHCVCVWLQREEQCVEMAAVFRSCIAQSWWWQERRILNRLDIYIIKTQTLQI
jgi:hypothetical protein